MIIKKIFSPATSIISLLIIILFSNISSKSDENNIKYYSNDEGILSIMYHRFNENKYPSTNIKIGIFEEHINIIKNSDFNFHNPNNFDEQFNKPKQKKEILITIDDAFESFYIEAWPYLKKNKIAVIAQDYAEFCAILQDVCLYKNKYLNENFHSPNIKVGNEDIFNLITLGENGKF